MVDPETQSKILVFSTVNTLMGTIVEAVIWGSAFVLCFMIALFVLYKWWTHKPKKKEKENANTSTASTAQQTNQVQQTQAGQKNPAANEPQASSPQNESQPPPGDKPTTNNTISS